MVYDLDETLVFMHWNQMDILWHNFHTLLLNFTKNKWQVKCENWKTEMLYSCKMYLLAVGVNMQYIFINH